MLSGRIYLGRRAAHAETESRQHGSGQLVVDFVRHLQERQAEYERLVGPSSTQSNINRGGSGRRGRRGTRMSETSDTQPAQERENMG